MTIDEAIHNLETHGRHMGNRFIAINHDKSVELLLKNAVIVLDAAGMIERDLERAFLEDDDCRKDNAGYKRLGHDCDRQAWEKVRRLWAVKLE